MPKRPEPAIDSRWRQRNGAGTICIVEFIANSHTRAPNYPTTVVYRDWFGQKWAKPLKDWERQMKEADLVPDTEGA